MFMKLLDEAAPISALSPSLGRGMPYALITIETLEAAMYLSVGIADITLTFWDGTPYLLVRNGFGVPLPKLGVESSCCHLLITLDPKETGHQQVYWMPMGQLIPLAL